jgi:hypothetical protein
MRGAFMPRVIVLVERGIHIVVFLRKLLQAVAYWRELVVGLVSGDRLGLLGLLVMLMLSSQGIDVCVRRRRVAILLLLQTRINGTGCGHTACHSRGRESKVESCPARRRMEFAKVGFRQQRRATVGKGR